MISVLCVTAFKDINRDKWSEKGVPHSRGTDKYLEWFSNLKNLPLNLICFADEPIASQIRNRTFFNNIYPYNERDTFFKYIEFEKRVMNSPYYKGLVASTGSWPEHSVPEYNIVNHNKVNFVRRAYEINPGYTHYAWIDFGFQRNPSSEPLKWDHILNNSINYAIDKPLRYNEIPDPETICRNPETGNIIQGALFTVPASLVRWYENAYEKALQHYYSKNLADDDQSVALLVVKNNPEKFRLHVRKAFRILYE